jgi:hypothetical protein
VSERSPVYKKSSVGQRGRQPQRQRFEELSVVVKRATDVVRKLDNADVAVRQTQHKQCFLARDFRGSNDVARGGIEERSATKICLASGAHQFEELR